MYSSCWVKSMALVGQNFSQALQVPFRKISAVRPVDDRIFWDSLREGRVDRLAVTQSGFVDFIDNLLRAFFLADATTCAELLVDIAGFLRMVTVKLPT